MPGRHAPRNPGAPIALAIVIALVFYAGLYPFNFFPENQVSALAHDSGATHDAGATFGGYGIALGEATSDLGDWSAARGISIELLVEPSLPHGPIISKGIPVVNRGAWGDGRVTE